MSLKDLIKPTVHLNGTPGERLRDGYQVAAIAVLKAQDALQAAAPNARDYYVQGDSVYAKARAEHDERVMRLREIREELMALAESVQDQLDAKERQRQK